MDTVEAYLAKDDAGMYRIAPSRQRPLFLLGAPGVGKTAIMAQIAQELGIGLVSYSMTHHTRQSALGLPFIVHREYAGTEFEVSEYTMSEIIASVYDYMADNAISSGILFLDEINCVSETLYPSMLQFLQFKTFGRHRVPANWIIVCAGNPPEYNKSVHEFDIVTLDRLRKIEVEPDYAAWKRYALDKGVHPAIMSFLEIKPDCFYSVETKPSGKSFVTARGWDDLSEIITLFEATGKPVDQSLVVQFVQDDEIAERFALYYDLFNKYRSDYRIDRILAGDTEQDVRDRAQAAPFDERLALISLLLDALASRLGEVVERESVLMDVRDVLRKAKPRLLEGGTVADTVGAEVSSRDQALARGIEAGTVSADRIRRDRLAIALLKKFSAECEIARTLDGEEAFDTIGVEYRGQVDLLGPMIEEGGRILDNAFDFVDGVFGDEREMLVFVTELTARRTTSRFINRFGNERYYERNERLMVDDRRRNLVARIDELHLDEKAVSSEPARTASGAVKVKPDRPPARSAGIPGNEMRSYYEDARFEFGFASLCKMTLPRDLGGKTVLDIGCRRGKGVFKLSERVGEDGRAIGVDWSSAYVDEASSRMERAWRDNGLPRNNMEFLVAYPEDLLSVGIGDSTVDVVFINSVVNLAYEPAVAFREIARVLRPGGMLVCETVVADGPRDPRTVEAARSLGNSIQAAPARKDLEDLLAGLGFADLRYREEHEVDPSRGSDSSHRATVAATEEEIRFSEVVMHACKG